MDIASAKPNPTDYVTLAPSTVQEPIPAAVPLANAQNRRGSVGKVDVVQVAATTAKKDTSKDVKRPDFPKRAGGGNEK